MPYASTMESLCMRTLLYFIDNPDEVLTSPDVRAKFGVRIKHLQPVLQPLIDRHMLAYTPNSGCKPGIYSAGPKLACRGGQCTPVPN